MGVQSEANLDPGDRLSSSHKPAFQLLERLVALDELARLLRVNHRNDDAAFSVQVDGVDVPLFRITPHQDGLLLSIRQGRRWEPTPECGSPEDLAQLLAGPLRFIWFIDAEDAAATAAANL